MKKSTIIALGWFMFAFIAIVFLGSCSSGEEKISISHEDFELVRDMGFNDPIIVRIVNESDSTIFDLNVNPLVVGKIYLRTKGILEPLELSESSIDLITTNINDTLVAKWVSYPDLWTKDVKNISSWKVIDAEVLVLKNIELNIDRRVYVSFDLPKSESLEIINTEIVDNDELGIIYPGAEAIEIKSVQLHDNLHWDGIKYHDDYLFRIMEYDTSFFYHTQIEYSNTSK